MNIKYDSNFGIIDYVSIVELIADGYFSENGDYIPHYGILNAMRIFYNECVIEDSYDIEKPVSTPDAFQSVVDDEDFINKFNEAIAINSGAKLDFAHAFADALDIVETKKNSLNHILDRAVGAFSEIVEKFAGAMSEDSVDKIVAIAKDISNGKLSNESIIEALGNSDMFKEIVKDK